MCSLYSQRRVSCLLINVLPGSSIHTATKDSDYGFGFLGVWGFLKGKNPTDLLKDLFIDLLARSASSPCLPYVRELPAHPARLRTCPGPGPARSPAAPCLSRSRRRRWPRPAAGGPRRSAPRPRPSAAAPARGARPPRTPAESAGGAGTRQGPRPGTLGWT